MFVVTLFSMQAICVRSNTVRRLGGTPEGCTNPKHDHGAHARRALLPVALSSRMPWAHAGDTEAILSHQEGNIKSPPCALRRCMAHNQVNQPRNTMLATSTRRRLPIILPSQFNRLRSKTLETVQTEYEEKVEEFKKKCEAAKVNIEVKESPCVRIRSRTKSQGKEPLPLELLRNATGMTEKTVMSLTRFPSDSFTSMANQLQLMIDETNDSGREDESPAVKSLLREAEELAKYEKNMLKNQQWRAIQERYDSKADKYQTLALGTIDLIQVLHTILPHKAGAGTVQWAGWIGAGISIAFLLYWLASCSWGLYRVSGQWGYKVGLLLPPLMTAGFLVAYLAPDIWPAPANVTPDQTPLIHTAGWAIGFGIFCLAFPFFMYCMQKENHWCRPFWKKVC